MTKIIKHPAVSVQYPANPISRRKKLLWLTPVALLTTLLWASDLPALGVIPATLTYTATDGGSNPDAQTFVVTNEGLVDFTFTNTVTYGAGDAVAWFTPSVTSGLIAASGALTVTGSVNIIGLNEGMHYATNTFTAPDATNSPQIMVVTLQVLNSARLWVAPTNFSKELTEGQAIGGDVFQVANTGAAPRNVMQYNVTKTESWLSVSPTNGTTFGDVTNTINISYDTTGLAAGWYTGRVTVAALGEGVGSQTVEVTMRVNQKPGLAWDAGTKVWTNIITAGNTLPATTVTVWNASGTPSARMNYTISVLNDPFGWVSVSPASGTSTGNQQTATVTYTTAGLLSGIYTAQLRFSGVDPATGEATTNGPIYVGLQLTINGIPTLKADVTSLSQTVLENHTGTSSFQLWNEGRQPRGGMRYTVTPDVAWASASPSTGIVTNDTGSIQVTWGTASLPAGTYTGNLLLDAFDEQNGTRAAGAPIVIPLTLTVTVRGPVNMERPSVVGTMYIGQTVAANVGLWQNQPRLTYAYQWERASSKNGDNREILSGAVGSTYVITAADRGKYLRVDVTATDTEPYPLSATANSAWVNAAKVKALPGDFNSDGITDLWFFDLFTGTWYASFGENNNANAIFPGGLNMIATPGDFDGDGNEDLGVYDAAHGMWHVCYLPRGGYAYGTMFGGTPEEAAATPVVADYDGDGASDLGLYYMGYWAILYSTRGAIQVMEPFAPIWGDPVPGDWDGDGITDLGVYDDGIWTLRLGNGSIVEQVFGGGAGVLPTTGDFDADGTTDLGVYDVGANQWRWQESRTGFEQSVSFGSGGTVAIPGYYDHDRSNDWAQVHITANNDFIVWEVKRTTETNFSFRGQSYQQSTGRWRVSW